MWTANWTIGGLLAGVLCIILWSATVLAEDDAWEGHAQAAFKAQDRGDFVEAERQFKAALNEVERFGPKDTRVAVVLTAFASMRLLQGRYADAESMANRALAIFDQALGREHSYAETSAQALALAYYGQQHYAEAEPLLQRVLTSREKRLGREHQDIAPILQPLATIMLAEGRYAEAEGAYERAKMILTRSLGRDHLEVARTIIGLAQVYRVQGRLAEAEQANQQALGIIEKELGSEHLEVAKPLSELALVYYSQGRYSEAEELLRRAFAILDEFRGSEHPDTAAILSSWAELYSAQGRYAEAEPLSKRALAIREKTLESDHPDVAVSLSNLATLYQRQGRNDVAEPLYRRALVILETRLGSDHPDLAAAINNLGRLYRVQQRYTEAETLYKRSLHIQEKALGPQHSSVAITMDNLAAVYAAQGKNSAAEPLAQRALEIFESTLGPDHPETATTLANLAAIHKIAGRPAEALPLIRRAAAIHRARFIAGGSDSELRNERNTYLSQLAIVFAVMKAQPAKRSALMAEALEAMQLSRASSVATVVAQMAARFASGSDQLAQVVRERQDAEARWRAFDARMIAAAVELPEQRNAQSERADRVALEELRITIARLDQRLAREFPAYAEIASPQPVTLDELQNLLAPEEALLAYAINEETSILIAIRRDRAELFQVMLGANALRHAVTELRASLMPEGIRTAGQLLERGFPATRAFELYEKLFAPAEEILQGTRLVFVVPDDALQSLPLGVLLTEGPQGSFVDFSGYAQAPWLARKYAMTVLPGISSIRALRRFAGTATAEVPFRGVGNPKLGPVGGDRSIVLAELFRGVFADSAALRRLPSLPDTEEELRAMARALGADAQSVLTGTKATEAAVRKGALTKARVIAFATHAAIAGQITGIAEPAIVLTPPAKASEQDDGLLTASEVAQNLELDADWVVLSACNTAAADGTVGAEGLSGLAKAFFYAGARALLVSHWSVESRSSVRLTTGAFEALAAAPGIGRAEALRRSMLDLLSDTTNPQYAHPMFWAPFVLVGEGGAGR